MNTIDPRKVSSIRKLQEAYFSLLAEGGENINILELCKKANVTRPTFYNNFSSILDLRKELHEVILNDLNETLTIKNPKPIDAFEDDELPENMVALFKHILTNKKAYEVLLLQRPDFLFIRDVKNILQTYIVEGIKHAGDETHEMKVKIPFAIAFITGAYYESIIWWIRHDYQHSPEEMAKLLLDISLYGPFEKDPNRKEGW